MSVSHKGILIEFTRALYDSDITCLPPKKKLLMFISKTEPINKPLKFILYKFKNALYDSEITPLPDEKEFRDVVKRYLKEKEELDKKKMEGSKNGDEGYETPRDKIVNKDKINASITIQKWIRGYLCRKELSSLKDGMTLDNVIEHIKGYNKFSRLQEEVNQNLTIKKIRKINYPSEITENIAKFAISKKYNIMGNWDIKPGDLNVLTKQIEVKGGFIENGPPTFGPDEKWDWIYFVDCEETYNMKYKVYEIKKSNIDFHNLKVNKDQTFGDQCIQGRRPRLVFSSIKEQFGENIKLIFDGHITELI